MDLSKLSDSELEALQKGDYSKLSDESLQHLQSQQDTIGNIDTASTSGSASFGRAILQGALPFEDRAVAAAKTGLAGLQELTGINTGANVKPTYEENLAMIRARNAASAEEHPFLTGAGKIAGGAASLAMLPGAAASKLGLTGEATLANTFRGGAALGGVQGLSEAKDLTDIPEALKSTAIGAAEGAIAAPIMSGVAKLGGAVLDRAAKTKMAQSMMQAARVGARGADVVGSEATADIAKQSEGRILDEFIPRIKKIEADLVGSTDPMTGQRTMGAYDTLYETANQKLPQGIDAQGLANRVRQFRDSIMSNRVMKDYYEQSGGLKQINGVLEALEERSGLKAPVMPEGMPEGMLPEASNAKPMSVSELRSEMQNLQNLYDKNPEQNGALLDLKKIYDSHMDDTLGNMGLSDIKSALDAKYAKLKNIKDTFGIKSGMTGIEPQEAARGVSSQFEKAAKSEPNALNDVGQAGMHLLDLDPEASSLLKTMAEDAENLAVSKSVNKETPIAQGMSKAHLSGHAISSNIGLLGGRVIGAAEKVPAFRAVQNIIKGTTNLANTEPEQVASLADHLFASENPITKRMGGLLQKVVTEPDPNKRRALMFSLSQQHAFREAVGNAFKDVTGVGEEK